MALKKAKYKVKAAGAEARYAVLPAAESAADLLGSALADTRDRLVPVVTEMATDARDRLGPALDDARKRVGPALDDVRTKVGPALDDARKKVGPALDDARKKVGPALDDAKKRVSPVLEDARDKVAPVASQALEQGRYHGTRLAQKAAAEGRLQSQRAAIRMGLVEEPKPSHKLRNALLVLLGLAGLAAVAYKKFMGRDSDPAWTMGRDTAAAGGAHRPPSPVAPAPPTDAARDVGGGELDESMATDEGAAARHAASLGTTRSAVSAAEPNVVEVGVDEGSHVSSDEPVIEAPPLPGAAEDSASTASGEAPPSNTTPIDPPTPEDGAESDGKGGTKSGSRKKKS